MVSEDVQPAPVAERGLAACVDVQCGLTTEQALRRVELTLAFAREENLAALDAALRRMDEIARGGRPRPFDAACLRLRLDADTIHSVGGVLGFKALSAAAEALCVYLGRLCADEAWEEERLTLFTGAMQRLRAHVDDPTSAKVVAGLRLIARQMDDDLAERVASDPAERAAVSSGFLKELCR